jgi:predicted nucleic acid-binding protein
MIIVDANVLANGLARDDESGQRARVALGQEPRWAAPDHVIAEALSSFRGMVRSGVISDQRGRHAVRALGQVTIKLLRVQPLSLRIWELRDHLTAYEAAYVSAAEAYECPLLTSAARLAQAHGLRCEVHLVDSTQRDSSSSWPPCSLT